MAAKMSGEDGITYRYGSPSSAGATTTKWYERPSNSFTLTQRPNADVGNLGQWQVGGPVASEGGYGDYFSNIGNVLYVANSTASTARTGVADVATISQQSNTFSQKPELPWVMRNYMGGGVDDMHAQQFGLKNPVAAARCYGRPGWCSESVVVYQDGTVSTAFGSNTAQNSYKTKLEAGKVPTAITITNSGEFALITVWDVAKTRGQIAVVALAGLCGGCTVAKPDLGDVGWGDWGATHPGLANQGNIAYMKVLGYVDLPENLRAPTEISATTGWEPWGGRVITPSGQYSAYKMPLAVESNRQTFITGNNVNAYAKAGVAVVVSKSEQRVAFIDLKPLFDYYKSMYFGPIANFNATKVIGEAPSQWPYTFDYATQQKPTLIKTMDMPSGAKPTAVKVSLWGPNARAWIATQEGALRVFDLGNYAQPSGTSAPSVIRQLFSVPVGSNPTSISYFRGDLGNMQSLSYQAIVLSRGERRVDWVNFNSTRTGGSVDLTKSLKDVRLVDPISIEDNENHGTEAFTLTLADYTGGTIRNYRYGNVIFHTNGGACQKPGCGKGEGLTGTDLFEYGGDLVLPPTLRYTDGAKAPALLPGKPFFITSQNVP
ncbi:hypothetical protein QTI66_18985 [Variovorax sp. J22R133]|uniref:hypothetical protein n=1 Tax=Variovorax brevis TaxID=3053503 RepID=UPI002577095C|nr:hypothetical protein [Variovorax sp. J22R133]MDM0114246.1 hypothetical protein [Variovorax sp. J22R133]